MWRPKVYLMLFLLMLALHPSFSCNVARAEPTGEIGIGSTEMIVNNSHKYSYTNEPVHTYLSFSEGEAFNNSIRIYDSSKREIPSQVWNVEYYPGTHYVRTCNITFLADLEASKNTRYWINYSSRDIGVANYSLWSDLKTSGDGFHKDVGVENSYLTAFVKANSTLGVYRFFLRPGNISLLWGNSSLTSYTLSLDGEFHTANDLQANSVAVKCKGPIFTQVVVSGSIKGIYISQSIMFYAHSPYIESSLEIVNSGGNVDWIRPMQIFFMHGVYGNYTLSTGENQSLETHALTYPQGNAYRRQSWWALSGRFGAILFLQKPLENLSFIILHDTPTFTTVANVGNETLIDSKSTKLIYQLRILLLRYFDLDTARAATKIFNQPPHATIELPVAFLSIDMPRRVQIYSRFSVKITITVLKDIRNCTLVLRVPSNVLNTSGKLHAYLGLLKKDAVRAVTWSLLGTSADRITIGASFRCREGSANASAKVLVYIPVVAPPVRVKIRALDFSGKLNMSFVNVTFLDSEAFVRLWVLTDENGYADCLVEPGAYLVRVTEKGKAIFAENITVFGPTSLTLNCSVFTAHFHIMGPDGRSLPEGSRALVILYENVTGRLVPIGSAISNSTGYALITGIRNGTYITKGYVRAAESGAVSVRISSEGSVHSLSLRFLTLRIEVVSDDDKPLRNCTISIYDFGGRLLDMRLVGPEGDAVFSNLAYQNYTYLVDWSGTRVASGFIYPNTLMTNVTIRSRVYTLTIEATDVWGNPLQGARVTVGPVQERTSQTLITDDRGRSVLLAPIGNYTVDVSSGGYVGSRTFNLKTSSLVGVRCSVNPIIYASLAMSSSGWIALGLVWRWKTRGVSYEELKVKEMLAKLEDLYAAGEVEYPLYRKLREEYSSQLRRVRSR